jgi:CHAT domain-containing protein
LYNLLFPFSLDAKIKQLVLVPDGSLNKLPFEALLSHAATTETKSFSDLHYLIRDYDLKYALSTGLYHRENRLPSGPAKRGEGLVAYAPVFAEPQDVSIFENELRSPLTGGAEAHLAATTADGSYLSSLPGTADEVSAIVEIFKKNNRPAESFLYAAASEQQIKQTGLSRSRYVHIATHGLVNEQQPNLSGLILYPDSSAQEDHILYSGEIYNLSLCADLVVLSACETGLGKVAGGEGLLGLSRAFFYAGADNLLVSLWKVDDLATAILMKAFYHHHLEDEKTGFTSALRQAKIEMIGSDTYSHPFFWSAFVLVD